MMGRRHAGLLLLVLVGLAVYGRTLGFPFLPFDDDRNVTANPLLLARDVAAFWRGAYYGLYIPVSYTLWTGLAALGGGAVLFHAANVALHLGNAWLVMLIGRRLVRDDLAALLGALLFLVHPVQVEAVAWVSGLRDLTSAGLALGAVLVHLAVAGAGGWALEVGLFALALLAKPSVACLPLALVALDVLTERRSLRAALGRALPGLAVAGAVALGTMRVQAEVTGQMAVAGPGWLGKAAVAVDAVGFYLTKLVWPVGLTPDHGRAPGLVLGERLWLWTGAVAVAAVAATWLGRRRLGRVGVAGLTMAGILLVPTLGLATFAFQRDSTVAERYLYLPLAGIAWAVAAAVSGKRPVLWLPLLAPFAIAAVFATSTWHDETSLFGRMVAENPRSFTGHIGLGAAAMHAARYEDALAHYEAALRLEPLSVTSLSSAGLALDRLGRYGEVLTRIRPLLPSPELTARSPGSADMIALMYAAVGYAELQTGDGPGGLATLCRAAAVDPRNGEIRSMVEQARTLLGRPGC